MAKNSNYWNALTSAGYGGSRASTTRLKQKRDWAAKNATYSKGIEKRKLQDRTWVRVDMDQNYRVWKNANFLAPDWFVIGIQKEKAANVNAKRPAMYHICGEIKGFVLFSKVPQKEGQYGPKCPCGDDVPDNIKMVFLLQKLKGR
jgi:hypothetical protein